MDEKMTDDEFSRWFSTYGLITSQRILGHYKISLPQNELVAAIKNTTSFYHRLVQVPLKNVLNGIILQQANDYHIYAQKLYIDYLLSGESGKPPESQGAITRENLEEERKALVNLGEQFNQKQLDHEAVIGSSQKALIKISKELKDSMTSSVSSIYNLTKKKGSDSTKEQIEVAILHALIHAGVEPASRNTNRSNFIDKIKFNGVEEIKGQLDQQLEDFFNVLSNANEQISELLSTVFNFTEIARTYRSQFYQTVLRVLDLIRLLPEYKIEQEQDMINRESLHFDKSIGEV